LVTSDADGRGQAGRPPIHQPTTKATTTLHIEWELCFRCESHGEEIRRLSFWSEHSRKLKKNETKKNIVEIRPWQLMVSTETFPFFVVGDEIGVRSWSDRWNFNDEQPFGITSATNQTP